MTKNQQEFTVVPDSIVFRDSKPGEMDSIDVWVTNVGRKPIQIRFKLQNDSKFNIFVENQQFTPPGLGIKAVLKYKCKEQQIIREELTIEIPGYSTKVPIMALPPCPRIVCDLPSLSIGNVGVDTKSKFTFSISNIGTREGTFNVSCEDETVEFIPNTGPLLPNKTAEIAATIKPHQVGEFTLKVTVNTQDQDLDPAYLTVTGNAVNHSLSLMIDDKEVSLIDFQTIFVGQKRVCDAKIVNQGQYKRSFVVMPARNTPTQKSRLDVTNNYLTQSRNQIFSAIPSEGTLNPYQSTPIRFIFNPPTDNDESIEREKEYKYYSSVEIVETSQHIDFSFEGKTVPLSVSLSATDFQFDTTAVMSRSNKQLVLKNNSSLQTSYKVKPIAHFRFEPSKGVINPNSSKTINIIFFPKTLGNFNISTPIIFSEGLITKTLNLIGNATKSGDDHKPFKREDPWLENDEIKFRATHPDPKYSFDINELEKRKTKREVFDKYLSEPRKKREQRQQEQEKKKKMLEKAKNYLENTKGDYTQEDLDEYMTHSLSLEDMLDDGLTDNGLTPPDPPLHIIETPLKSYENDDGLNPENNEQNNNSNQNKTLLNNSDNLIKKKFKSKATTPAEINECSHPLTPAQQLLVTASHETMNFGQVSVYSSVARSFTITNNLQQNIIVSINYEYDELSKSGPVSQVIPPKQIAGFDIRFLSNKPQNFMKTITYTVNNAHSYSVNICAQVIPIDVQLSKSSMEFRFAGDSTLPVIREFITVINRSMAPAQYKWIDIKPPFSISNINGTIDPNSSQNIEISYNPGNHPHDEQNITLTVAGGPNRSLRLIGDVGSPKCSINKRSLAFGLMPIGILKTQQIRLKNSGDDDAIFSINTNGSRELSVSPVSGKVSARDQQMIQISFKANHAKIFDLPVTISICGASPITFNVTAQSELPNVCITNTEFDFGRVFVGSYQSIEGTIKNIGAIPAILFLDLSQHPEFRIEYQTDLSDISNNENKNSISLVSDPFFVTKMVPAQEYMSMESTTSLAYSAQISSTTSTTSLKIDMLNDIDNSNVGLVYKIQIMDNSQIKFNLVFQPTKQGDHSFELPITLLNMMSSSSFHLQPIVSGEAVLSPIIVSNSSIDFGICPVIDKLNPGQRKVSKTISLLNDSKTKIGWRLDTSVIPKVKDDFSFTVEPIEGELDIGSSEVIHVQFQPPSAQPFNCYIPLLSKGKEESVIGKIQFTGVGTSSMFSVSVPEISLPIVPLNTKSQLELYVKNDGYIDGLLKATISADENVFPVKVTFPDGNQLLHTQEKLPILVTFQASKPMSFSVNVALTDDNGHATSFSVTCTTDNSIFTLYPYFANQVQLNAKSTVDDLNKFLNNSELTSRFICNSGDYTQIKGQSWEPLCSQMMIKFVMRYFNALFFSTQLSEFPQGLVANQGLIIQEMMTNFVPNTKKNEKQEERASTAVDDKFSKRLESIKKLLTNLKSMGALLGSVKPEFLLSRQDFVQVMRQKIIKQLLGIDKFGAPDLDQIDPKTLSEFTSSNAFSSTLVDRLKVIETLYNNLSIESWMIVLMQCFKIYGINRINAEKFNNIPGVQNAIKLLRNNKPNQEDLNDQINKKMKESQFNNKEVAILKWLSIYSCIKTNDPKAIQTDFGCLKDGFAFCCSLAYHTKLFTSNISFPPTDKREKEQNAIEFTNCLKYLKLGFSPSAEEIFGGNDCMNAMIGCYLMDIIPHFIPLQTIEFSGPLHKPISRVVSVTNPSKSEITYRAIFEGNQNYQIQQESIFVGPNQTVDFPVTFLARTIKPLTGRLTLIPSRPRYVTNTDNSSRSTSHPPTYSAPIVVDFVSNITVSAPETSVTVDTSIYNNLPIKIPVKNMLNTTCKMNIYSQVTYIQDENGKEVGTTKSLLQQISSFVQNPFDNSDEYFDYSKEKNIDNIIKNHKTFILNKNQVEFTQNKNDFNLELDFNPIKLGTYRCLVLFIDDNKGEFVVEVIGNCKLPAPVDILGKYKVEAGKKITQNLSIDLINLSLFNSLAFSIERHISILNGNKDARIKDEVNRRQHDLENIYKACFQSKKFTVLSSSPQYYEMSNELTISKSNQNVQTERSNNSKNLQNQNSLAITFKPTKAGEYPCKVVLISENDVRVFNIKGVSLQTTHEFSIEFQTTTGKSVKQDIPFTNPSNENWTFKTSITGDQGFQTTPRFTVKGGTTQQIQIQFNPNKVGTFNCDLLVQNLTKESAVLYKITAIVEEPPAEDKVIVHCQARIPIKHKIQIPKFTMNPIKVTSDIPIITFEKQFSPNASGPTDFEFEISASRSGICAGMIKFIDSVSQNHIWYVVEIHVSAPAVEQQLNVNTVARQSVSVQIPISNPNDFPVNFNVTYQDTDISGIHEFLVPSNGQINYQVTVTPLKSCNKISSIYFYSESGGEFWYNINIIATDPSPSILAPLSAPIGKFDKTFIALENPTDKAINFRLENDYPNVFDVLCKRMILLQPGESKRIEVRYIPSLIGTKESSTISFISNEIGTFSYIVSGIGKPPQPLSPTIISSVVSQTNSALILFSNPFSFPSRFSVTMTSTSESFSFLVKKKVFTLNTFGEEFQNPFTFTPKELGQFQASIIIVSLGPARSQLPDLDSTPGIRWVYPIIGNSLASDANESKVLKTKSMETIDEHLTFTLVGETESLQPNEYEIRTEIPQNADFISSQLSLNIIDAQHNDTGTDLIVEAHFSPMRPIVTTVISTVKNTLGQEWQFRIDLISEIGKPIETITIESLLNKVGVSHVETPPEIHSQKPFHAYFATGSASEFSVSPSHGLAIPGSQYLPVEITFSPKTYGKLLKGMFVIDMIDSQYIYDVVGKMPDYVPPVVAQSSLAPIVAPIDSPSKRKSTTKLKKPYLNSRK